MRITYLLLCLVFLSGCTGSVLTAIAAADIVSGITTGKTAASNVMSEVTGKDCQIFHFFKGKKVCQGKSVKELMDMGCDIYCWVDDDEPYCKRETTK